MKKRSPPRQMTFRQFILFLILGGIAIFFLIFKFSGFLHYGDPLYPVEDYSQLSEHLASNPDIILPTADSLPSSHEISFYAYEQSRKKLDPTRDGYSIAIFYDGFSYSIDCSPKNDPMHRETAPGEIRPDLIRFDTPVALNENGYPVLEFLIGNYYYALDATALTADLPESTLDTLLNLTDNILQQAG